MMKRIKEMEWELFPLDRLLPKATVSSYLQERYRLTDKKSDLLKNTPENKRFREGYWSLFACLALDIIEGKEHFLLFPSDPSNDVTFLSERDSKRARAQMNRWEFDVKEYESHSVLEGFNSFLQESVNPVRSLYGVIVGVHCDIQSVEPSSLCFGENDRGVFLISSDTQNQGNYLRARVVFVLKGNTLFDQILDLAQNIDTAAVPVIFHNDLRKPLF